MIRHIDEIEKLDGQSIEKIMQEAIASAMQTRSVLPEDGT